MLKKVVLSSVLLSTIISSLNCVNKEIEIKFQIPNDSQFNAFKSWIEQNANNLGEERHLEFYVVDPENPQWDYSAGFKDTLETRRVRITNKGDSYCYKKRILDPETKKTTHREEREEKIENGDNKLEQLRNEGFKEVTKIKKTRDKYLFNEFEICVDDVEGIGSFIEVELKKEVDDPKVGLAEIRAFLKNKGITDIIEFDRGYIHMKWNPNYNFGESVKL